MKKPTKGGEASIRRPKSKRLAAVRKLFTDPELAKICKVTRQAVNRWVEFPPKHAIAVEKASKGKLTRQFLAPSFYPAAAD